MKKNLRANCRQIIAGILLLRMFSLLSFGPLSAAELTDTVDFGKQIRPIFNEHCIACHGGVKQSSGLSFIYRESVFGGGDTGVPAVVPGDPEASYLIERVSAEDDDYRMPPAEHGSRLTPEEIELLTSWISQGAHWKDHWAYLPSERTELPRVDQPAWCAAATDFYVLARLEAAELAPSSAADEVSWLRRAAFDLIGLPPTLEECAAFLDDNSPEARQRVLDRLLASPQFGERWATTWLDLARYSDTMGYEKDPHRDIWPYRDWVIRAFNNDMPFDEFTIKQLAGDLLPQPAIDDLVATAFHRNTQTNTEGGTDDEEFRIAAVIDRVSTTWQAWQATTFGCAQCHAHPYEPIRHDEFYQFLATFNTSRDCDLPSEEPLLQVPIDPADEATAMQIYGRMSELRRLLYQRTANLAESPDHWQPFTPDQAVSTRSTALTLHPFQDFTEVRAGGTLSDGSVYTIEGPLPNADGQWQAMRIDVLPEDFEAAVKTPEMGFVLSRLQAYLVQPGEEEPQELDFEAAFCDEAEPTLDPADSFKDNSSGWASLTRLHFPRYGVFVFKEPLRPLPGMRLRIVLTFSMGSESQVPLVIRRGRISLSHDGWSCLVNDAEIVSVRRELEQLAKTRSEMATVAVPVMKSQPDHLARHSFVFDRGNWLEKGQEVQPGIPDVFSPLPGENTFDRLALARWLVSPDNPLAARVAVNRYWQQLFGVGIVETAEDFGSSGAPPTHPKLLDHLALRFSGDFGWSTKRLLREIVLSATYGQDEKTTASKLASDPRNRLLSRGPRNRLSAEMVRDQALSVSGLLAGEMYGPPVMPPQPDGVWRSVYSGAKWENSEGADRYRRSIYTYWKRTSGYPSFLTFDAPSRDVCTVRRITTNTPLQALVTLNDPVYMECAVGLADRMSSCGEKTARERIRHGYRLATGEFPSVDVTEELCQLYDFAVEQYQHSQPAGLSPTKSGDDSGLIAVANAILNLDAVLAK